MYRDYQIILTEDDVIKDPEVKTTQSESKVVVDENQSKTFRVLLTQKQSAEYEMELNTELGEKNYSINVYDSVKDESVCKVAKITLIHTADVIRNNPYTINVRSRVTTGERAAVIDKNFSFFTKAVDFFEPLGPVIPTNTDEATMYSLLVRPNPTRGRVQIEGAGPVSNIKVFDLKGLMVFDGVLEENHQLDLSTLPPGVYIMQTFGHGDLPVKAVRIVKI